MLKVLICIITFVSINAFGMSEVSRDEIITLIPEKLSSFSNETSSQIQDQLKGKITSKTDIALYLKDATIGLKDGKYKYLLVQADDEMTKKSQGLFARIYSTLSPEEKAKVSHSLNGTDHSSGRIISIDLPKLGVKLDFDNNSAKSLNSILIWPVGGEHP